MVERPASVVGGVVSAGGDNDKGGPGYGITSVEYLEATDWVAHGIERLTDNPYAIRLAKALKYGIHRECVGGERATERALKNERIAIAEQLEARAIAAPEVAEVLLREAEVVRARGASSE